MNYVIWFNFQFPGSQGDVGDIGAPGKSLIYNHDIYIFQNVSK